MNDTEIDTVEIFLKSYYPRILDDLVTFIDDLESAGQITTLDDLRNELAKLSIVCREYGKNDEQ